MGRASTQVGSTRVRSRLGQTRCPLRGPVTVKNFYIRPAPTRSRLDGQWAERPGLSFVFSVKLSKIQKNNIKHEPYPQEARARGAGPGRGQNLKISGPKRCGPTLTSLDSTGPVISPSTWAEPMNRPDPCPSLVVLLRLCLT